MRGRNSLAFAAIVLGLLAILLSIGEVLALLDIAQGKEPNLTLEWGIVWTALLVIVIAQIVSIAAILSLLLRRRPREVPQGARESTPAPRV